jgi:hypothetical protein
MKPVKTLCHSSLLNKALFAVEDFPPNGGDVYEIAQFLVARFTRIRTTYRQINNLTIRGSTTQNNMEVT